MTEYSLDSPFRTIDTLDTFTLFDGAGGGAVTGAGGGGAGGRTGSGIIRPMSRSLMRRFGSEFISVGRLRIKDSLPTYVATRIFCACSFVTSTVTALAIVGFPSASLASSAMA